MDIHDLIKKLEPEHSTTAAASPEQDLQLMSITSIALSLKRIADMLDGTTLGLNCMETIFNPTTVQNRDIRNHY